ncbi:efflux RND transporter permease subunit [Calothrix sp. PCC 7507]|uniref:efflux RND transporter permease subunit n=1 Tax=Calothrix sp. PCC 7507 TaxID=99598 RepID=UPI00029EDB31|nr:efflux RND transporter permease subunit [Calothrix sp. PCC 7507]AFY34063.1 transporter, hydrophobe/amphiphile efflux-1 (HAE1) family [Calothrix sp. PCC 7507]
MSIADTFIRRPVLATVCTLLISLVGAISISLLPINNLPDIAPIQIQTSSNYIGADSQTVEDTVTTVLERQINGVEGMQYMTSTSTNNGVSSISGFFDTSTNKNINQVNVQNRAAIANPTLPDAVRQTGVTTLSRSSSILRVYGFYSANAEYDSTFISNYVDLFVTDTIKRVPGVGDVSISGQRQYAMRLWLDPNALASRGLTADDVATALTSQNVQVGAGAIGQAPTGADQPYNFALRVQGRFKEVKDFENLILKTQSDGSLVKLKDVGRAELGAEDYSTSALVKGKPGVAMLIYQLPGSNALEVVRGIEAAMEELKQNFPPGLTDVVGYDTTRFVEVSIEEVLHTLIEAVFLVVLVIFIFLQDWRATIIPTIAVPVSLVGALAFALVFGFSLNTLTMFGLVLATGLVVDDAIIVVEGISTKMEQGMNARDAAFASMKELTGAVIATSLVLMAVFVPVSFFPGATGIMYRQFALIIVFAIAISAFNALTFTPSMAAILLRREGESKGVLGWFFRQFNRGFTWFVERYRRLVSFLIRIRMIVIGLFILGLVATVWVYGSVPNGFVPDEDQSLFAGIIQAPDGVPITYTEKVGAEVFQILEKNVPEMDASVIISGFGLNGNGPNQGTFFVRLKDWEERHGEEHSVAGIVKRLNGILIQNQKAFIVTSNLPAVSGFGITGGFEFQLQDRTGGQLSIDQFLQIAQQMIAKANQHPALDRVFTQFSASTPQYQIEMNRDRLEALNVDFSQALRTLGAYMGGRYVNDFTFAQRNYRVYIQADQQFRNSPDDIGQVYVRSRNGNLVRLSEVATIKPITGPQIISHFNLFRTIKIQGAPKPGYSSGQAIAAMKQVFAENTQPGLGYDWTGLSREEIKSGGQAGLVFALGIVVVFLVLAAQYENYVDPFIILLTVPLAILGAMLFVSWRGLVNDLYCQVALVMLIGLASKNAILIVEFANQSREQGMTIAQAAIHAAQQRFRPILMTASAALVGFYPLVTATGAGSASRWSLGTAVFGGLLVATILSFLLVPVLYVVIKNLVEFVTHRPKPPTPPSTYVESTEHKDSNITDKAPAEVP